MPAVSGARVAALLNQKTDQSSLQGRSQLFRRPAKSRLHQIEGVLFPKKIDLPFKGRLKQSSGDLNLVVVLMGLLFDPLIEVLSQPRYFGVHTFSDDSNVMLKSGIGGVVGWLFHSPP
jgi:hypothetical protein